VTRIPLAILFGALVAGGCGTETPEPEPESFLAFAIHFAPFRTWPSFHSDGPPDDGKVLPEVLGPRTQYINKLPPAGSTEFPVGTMIVEARENGGMKIFAGAKRGLGFNSGGATDWEWFELTENPTAMVKVEIAWRGVGPPLGDTYGGDPDGCNSCHVQCASNDFICSPKLQFATF
jgi:hypothetical protein